ncbi:hypothetical protein RclHR1_14660001 [Rhizophagus clarus]|uniref:Uncharacterized protein n=1 Tax=Rhizophagus clarus TaxID=94130 RepID=A0A2Z6QD51_9GLOM|nr:hypothetical protein RclHR1_14660001 [Rhizophagus clarus]
MAGEAKTTVDSHHAQIGREIQEGNDITLAIKDIASTSVTHIKPNQIKENKKGKAKSTTIPNWFEWT